MQLETSYVMTKFYVIQIYTSKGECMNCVFCKFYKNTKCFMIIYQLLNNKLLGKCYVF